MKRRFQAIQSIFGFFLHNLYLTTLFKKDDVSMDDDDDDSSGGILPFVGYILCKSYNSTGL